MFRRVKLGALAILIDLEGDKLPREFRLLTAGWNDSENGRYLFDAKAAEDVMTAYRAHKVDKMMDLEHLSLDPAAPNFDPDARAWYKLEVRNGELWATDVRWTDDGATRLTSRRQRYISPTFLFDKDRRVAKIHNIALTALPALHGTPALAAARVAALTGGPTLDQAQFAQIAEALGLAPDSPVEDVLAAIGAMAKSLKDALSDEKAEPDAADAAAMGADGAPMAGEKPEAVMAAAARLTRITGKTSIGAAVSEAEVWRGSHLELAAERDKLAKERATLEASERDSLTVSLVMNGESPGTAWTDPVFATDKAKRKPAEPWASMPLEQLRARVVKLTAAVGGKPPRAPGPKPPVKPATVAELSPREAAMCLRLKLDPAKYAANKAAIAARTVRSAPTPAQGS